MISLSFIGKTVTSLLWSEPCKLRFSPKLSADNYQRTWPPDLTISLGEWVLRNISAFASYESFSLDAHNP
jgi:hypothetical protein